MAYLLSPEDQYELVEDDLIDWEKAVDVCFDTEQMFLRRLSDLLS